MPRSKIRVAAGRLNELWDHLLPSRSAEEEAAFGFAQIRSTPECLYFDIVEINLLTPECFAARSPWFLELTDDARAHAIKHAHDSRTALLEFHSHPDGHPQFSWSDNVGLREFAPHVRWRLGGTPYAAVVVAPTGCDAVAWIDPTNSVSPVAAIEAGSTTIRPSGWSARNWEKILDERETL